MHAPAITIHKNAEIDYWPAAIEITRKIIKFDSVGSNRVASFLQPLADISARQFSTAAT
jgi:hypothetical protein